MDSKIKIHIISPTNGSIGEITEDLKSVLKEDFELINYPHKESILFAHMPSITFITTMDISKYSYTILSTHIDGSTITERVRDGMNRFNLIIVPTTVAKETLVRSGVTIKIEVIPLYVKSEYLTIKKTKKNSDIIFYHESFASDHRKGVRQLCDAFTKAFEGIKKVKLIVKCRSTDRLNTDNPNIEFITDIIERDRLIKLMHTCDVYVSFAFIEGFGLPLLRSYLLNKRIVVVENEFSGYNDYLIGDNIYKIKSQFGKLKNLPNFYAANDDSLALPDIDDSTNILLQVYNDVKSKKSIKPVSNEVIESFSLDSIYQQYKKIITNEYINHRSY